QGDSDTRVAASIRRGLNGKRALVGSAGRRQVASFFKYEPEIPKFRCKVGMIGPALLFTQCDRAFEQWSRRGRVMQIGEHITEVGQVGSDRWAVGAKDRDALVEDELEERSGALEVALPKHLNSLFGEVVHAGCYLAGPLPT